MVPPLLVTPPPLTRNQQTRNYLYVSDPYDAGVGGSGQNPITRSEDTRPPGDMNGKSLVLLVVFKPEHYQEAKNNRSMNGDSHEGREVGALYVSDPRKSRIA